MSDKLISFIKKKTNSFLLDYDNRMKITLVNKLSFGAGRYVTAGAAWLNGAFSKVSKAGQVAGTKTREKFHMAVSNLTAKVDSNIFLS